MKIGDKVFNYECVWLLLDYIIPCFKIIVAILLTLCSLIVLSFFCH